MADQNWRYRHVRQHGALIWLNLIMDTKPLGDRARSLLYDITATLSWYYVEYAVELFALAVFVVHLFLFTLEKVNQRRLNREMETIELQQTTEVFQNAE